MTFSTKTLLGSRSVASLFGLQAALFFIVFTLPGLGLGAVKEIVCPDIVAELLTKELTFTNEVIVNLLPVNVTTKLTLPNEVIVQLRPTAPEQELIWLALLTILIIYYITAVFVAIPGRAVYRYGRQQLSE